MNEQLNDLYRRTGLTKESAFHASYRMRKHDSLSLWSLTTLAFCLIIISMVSQFYADNVFIIDFKRFIDLSITSMSIFALVMSVLIQKSNFSVRSEQYRTQAKEINELRISFKHLINKESIEESVYEKLVKEYANILNGNVVHEGIDYDIINSVGIGKIYNKIKMFLLSMLVTG